MVGAGRDMPGSGERCGLHRFRSRQPNGSERLQRLLGEPENTCSMSRTGNVWGNPAMENFFSTLKTGRIAHKTYRTRNVAKPDFDYIDRFCNPKRCTRRLVTPARCRSSGRCKQLEGFYETRSSSHHPLEV